MLLQIHILHQVLDLEELVQEEEKKAPLICLLTTGSDPCSQVEGMARAAETEYRQISMGQVGCRFFRFWWRINRVCASGPGGLCKEDDYRGDPQWPLVDASGAWNNGHFCKHVFSSQNCHLCLDFCEEIITTVVDTEDMHRNFR